MTAKTMQHECLAIAGGASAGTTVARARAVVSSRAIPTTVQCGAPPIRKLVDRAAGAIALGISRTSFH